MNPPWKEMERVSRDACTLEKGPPPAPVTATALKMRKRTLRQPWQDGLRFNKGVRAVVSEPVLNKQINEFYVRRNVRSFAIKLFFFVPCCRKMFL